MTIVDAKFLQSAQSVNDSPAPNVAEVAFQDVQMQVNLQY